MTEKQYDFGLPQPTYPCTQGDMEAFRCPDPECPCPTIWFGASCCHAGQPGYLTAVYDRQHGRLTLACQDCHEVILTVLVAPGETVPRSPFGIPIVSN